MTDSLEVALAHAGIATRTEARERLVILIPHDGETDLTSEDKRRVAVALASERGFTHIALELLD